MATNDLTSEPPRSAAARFTRTTILSTLSYCGGAIAAVFAAVLPLTATPRLVFVCLILVLLVFHVSTLWRKKSKLGHRAVVRMLVAAAVALSFSYHNAFNGQLWTSAAAFTILAMPIALESILGRATARRTVFVSNVPGVTVAQNLPKLDRPTVTASAIVIVIGAVVSSSGMSPIWWLVASIVMDAWYLAVAVMAIKRIRADMALKRDLPEAVSDYQPEFVIYNALPDQAPHQVMMWLPYLERTGHRFIIVCRNDGPARALAELTDAPIVTRRSVKDLEKVLVDSINAVFYVNASSGNGTMVRYPDYNHVFLGHGDSDKPTSYNPLHAMYDTIFAAGPAATRRYSAHGVIIDSDKFQVVGRPQLESVDRTTAPISTVDAPTVFYAPTWRGHVEETLLYSLPIAPAMIKALLARDATIIFRPHPFSYQFPDDVSTIELIHEMLLEDRARTGRDHLFGAAAETEIDVFEATNLSDVMISDVSSVVSDYLYSGKPFAMVAVSAHGAEFVEQYPIAEASYVLEGDLSNLDSVLDQLLHTDPRRNDRLALRTDYLGDFPADNYASHFVSAAQRMITTQRRHEEADVSDDTLSAETNEPDSTPTGAPENGDTPEANASTEEANAAADEEVEDDEIIGSGRSLKSALRRLWRRVAGKTLIPTAFAVAAFVLLIISAPAPAIVTVGLLGTVVHLFLNRRAIKSRRQLTGMLRAVNSARALLSLAVGLFWVAAFGWSWEATAGSFILVFTCVMETGLSKAWGVTGLEARNLPGIETRGFQPVDRGVVAAGGTIATAVWWIFAYSGVAPIIPFIVSLVAFALCIMLYCSGLVRGRRSANLDAQLPAMLEEYSAEFAVYFASTMGITYQLGMWLPYLDRIGKRYIVVTRNVSMMRAAGQITDSPVINRPTLRSLEDVITPSLKLAFYVNNAGKNTHFIERRELAHVWLNHGDSEKPACFNPVHAIYDFIFSAGQAGVDRYARHGIEIPREKFKIVGRPQVEGIERAATAIKDIENKTVLYAPTWKGPYKDTEVYSLPLGDRIVAELLARGCTVVFRAHSLNYRFSEARAMIKSIGEMLDADNARTGRPHVWGAEAEKEMGLEECFNASDAMIADVSAVVSDFLQSGKPLAMVSVGRTAEQLAEDAPASKASYVIKDDLANLDGALDKLLGEDPLAAEREQMRVYYLGDFDPERYADVFVNTANDMINSGPVRVLTT